MKFEIKWDADLEGMVGDLVRPALKELAEKRTRQYRKLAATHQGGDIEVVKAELKRLYEVDGGSLTDPDLTQHAEAIIAGQRIEFRADY